MPSQGGEDVVVPSQGGEDGDSQVVEITEIHRGDMWCTFTWWLRIGEPFHSDGQIGKNPSQGGD